MLLALQILAVVLVAIGMGVALTHALEVPGKARLTQEQYLAVQPIYYPGLTLGGAGAPLGLLACLLLLFLLPAEAAAFWLTAAAALCLAAMHALYWLWTHPANRVWLRGLPMNVAGRAFFAFDPLGRPEPPPDTELGRLRDRWELSHVVRAPLALLALILLVVALALRPG